jgi:D-3-phosphoglycerate dehydrogenase
MLNKILIIDAVHDLIPVELSNNNFRVIDGTAWTKEEIKLKIPDFYGIILRSKITIDKEIIDKATNLKFIARVGAGMESIDTEYCKQKGVICLNSPEGNRDAVAEHAIGMLMSLLNNITKANSEVKAGIWSRESNRGTELNNKTLGIIGYGNMGHALAKRLLGFGCKVLSYDKYKFNYTDQYAEETSLNDIFDNTDILSLHVPLTYETKYMVDEDFISKFKKPFYLINTARGPIVRTSALVEALKTGKILGAALDVIEYEETSFENLEGILKYKETQYLANCDNVILTPHIAGWTVESKIKLAQVLVDKILKLNQS